MPVHAQPSLAPPPHWQLARGWGWECREGAGQPLWCVSGGVCLPVSLSLCLRAVGWDGGDGEEGEGGCVCVCM